MSYSNSAVGKLQKYNARVPYFPFRQTFPRKHPLCRLLAVLLVSSDHARAQSDGKLMQIRKVNEERLGRGSVSLGSRLPRSLESRAPSRATELRKRDCS